MAQTVELFDGTVSESGVALDGKLVHTLAPPDGSSDLGHPVATDYFRGRGNFVPTDTEQLDGLLYVTTGYSNLDFVLTARILSTNPFRAAWHDLAFGGKGGGVDRDRDKDGRLEPNGHAQKHAGEAADDRE